MQSAKCKQAKQIIAIRHLASCLQLREFRQINSLTVTVTVVSLLQHNIYYTYRIPHTGMVLGLHCGMIILRV